MTRIYSSRQVGKLVGADPSSVNRWIDSGRLKAYRTPGGHRRVLYDDLLKFLGDCGIPIPEELKATSITLLIVDDDEKYLRSLRKALMRMDRSLDIQTCNSGIEALILLGARRPDVIVLDIYMPGWMGWRYAIESKAIPRRVI
jgi:excisionase family DNA binding protein